MSEDITQLMNRIDAHHQEVMVAVRGLSYQNTLLASQVSHLEQRIERVEQRIETIESQIKGWMSVQ